MNSVEKDLAIARILEETVCRKSLAKFIQCAWHVLEPNQPYTHGRHIDVMCEHLEAVEAGQIRRLLINVPPGCMKSLLVGVFYPMWVWGPKGKPSERIVSVSHEQTLAIRDNLKSRRLIDSQWYKDRYPHVKLTKDQNAKQYFENTQTGFRQATTTSSLTGRRGDMVVFDDPLSASGANSDAELEACRLFIKETLPTRTNNPATSAIVGVMQRLHEKDPTGVILSEGLDWEHLMLPMRFEPKRACVTVLGDADWRTEDGELLFPERFPEDVVDELEKTMGPYATAGQHQQSPVPRGGGMFQKDWFSTKDVTPGSRWKKVVRAWDLAATEGGGDWTVGVKIGLDAHDKDFIILDVIRFQHAAHKRDQIIKQTAIQDGQSCRVIIEQEPGSAGKAVIEDMKRKLIGYACKSYRPTGPKEVRAEPLASACGLGKVFIGPDADWLDDFLREVCVFPFGSHDDQVDAVSMAFNDISKGGVSGGGLLVG